MLQKHQVSSLVIFLAMGDIEEIRKQYIFKPLFGYLYPHLNQSYNRLTAFITKTSPCNKHPLTPHFYIVKLGFNTGVYFFFLFLLQNIDCGYSLEPPH